MRRKKKHNYSREALLQAVREMERVLSGLYEVLGYEVTDEASKECVRHFNRGANFVLGKLRQP